MRELKELYNEFLQELRGRGRLRPTEFDADKIQVYPLKAYIGTTELQDIIKIFINQKNMHVEKFPAQPYRLGIYSYATPIAVVKHDKLIVVKARYYSATTSKQVTMLLNYLRRNNII